MRMAGNGLLNLAGHSRYLRAAGNKRLTLPHDYVMDNFVDHPNIAEHVFNAGRARLKRYKPYEAGHVEGVGSKSFELDHVGQGFVSGRSFVWLRPPEFKHLPHVPKSHNLANRIGGTPNNCGETAFASFHIKEEIIK